MGRKLKVELKEIYVNENGVLDEGDTSNFFEALWVHPKLGLPSVRSILELNLKDKDMYFDSKLKEEQNKIGNLDPRKYPDPVKKVLLAQLEMEMEKSKLLFKQEIEDVSYLEFNISLVQERDKFSDFLTKIFGVAVNSAFGTIPGLGKVASAIGSATIESVFEGIKTDKRKLKSIARGSLKVDETILGDKTTIEKQIFFYVPKDMNIYPEVLWEEDGHGGYKVKQAAKNPKPLLKGQENGYIKLVISEIK